MLAMQIYSSTEVLRGGRDDCVRSPLLGLPKIPDREQKERNR